MLKALSRFTATLALATPAMLAPLPLPAAFSAAAQGATLVCESRSNAYKECYAGNWQQPVLLRQLSKTQCVEEQNWGYNRKTRYIWVDSGCSGEFADGGPGGAAGCHGNGCLVDNPDAPPPPPRKDLSVDGVDRCVNAALEKSRSMGHSPRVNRIIDHYPDNDGYHVEGEIRVNRSKGSYDMQFLCLWNGSTATVMFGSGR